MSKISCDICVDLMPLVKDEVASGESKKAVMNHIESCKNCSELYGREETFIKAEKNIILKIKKNLITITLIIIALGILFGISLAASQFMFYNIILMPFIGAISYFALGKKSIYVLGFVFLLVYLRWLYDSFGYALNGDFIQAFLPPFYWALIYLGLAAFGSLIGFLLHFGFNKEEK